MTTETKTEARKSLRERLREAQENYDSMASMLSQEHERAGEFEAEAKRLRTEHARLCEMVSAAKAEGELLRMERDARATERDEARASLASTQRQLEVARREAENAVEDERDRIAEGLDGLADRAESGSVSTVALLAEVFGILRARTTAPASETEGEPSAAQTTEGK